MCFLSEKLKNFVDVKQLKQGSWSYDGKILWRGEGGVIWSRLQMNNLSLWVGMDTKLQAAKYLIQIKK